MKGSLSYIIILMICLLFGCAGRHEHVAQLNKIAIIVEDNIDSAQVLLNQVDTLSLSSSEQNTYDRLLLRIRFGRNESLLPYYDEINRLIQINQSDNRSWGLLYMSRYKTELGQLKEAIPYCHQVLNEVNATVIKTTVLLELGRIYQKSDNTDEALEQYKKAYALSLSSGNSKKEYFSLRGIGNTFLFKKMPDSAFIYLHKAMEVIKTHRTLSNMKSTIYSDLSILYQELNEYEKASFCLSQAISLDKDSSDLLQDFLNKGELLLQMNQPDSARYYLKLSSTSQNIYTSASSFYYLYATERASGNTEKALAHFEDFYARYDSIMNQAQTLEIQRLHYNYEIEKRITEEQEKFKSYIELLVITLLIFIFTGIILYQRRARRFKEKIIGYQQDILRTRAEIEKLQEIISNADNKKSETVELLQQLYSLIKEETVAAIKLFKFSEFYSCLNKSQQRKKDYFSLNYTPDVIERNIYEIFSGVMKHLKLLCLQLTSKDLYLCCLLLIKLDNSGIAFCFGQVDTAATNQRKYRIKEKVSQVQAKDFLLDLLFNNN